ncbi:hypothetical protein [Pantoea stewartii]|uniref:hypothetical protein n=1 Tax=Pantoea stewartii TaxID=66269 RepID=UPI0033666F66
MIVILNNRAYLFAESDTRSLLQPDKGDRETLERSLMANCAFKVQLKAPNSSEPEHRED